MENYNYIKFSPIIAEETTYHYDKAMAIKKYLENEKFQNMDNNLIALYGEWGSGKSTVFRTLKNELEKSSDYTSLIFEAWKYEKDKNLPLSLYEFILDNIINDKKSFFKVLTENTIKGLYSFGKGFTFNFGVGSYEVGKIIEEAEKDQLYSLYTLTENFIEEFQNQIEKNRKGKKIVVFIDDLDRCEDENIVNLISALKLMFSLKNIIFICGIDKKALINSVKMKYLDENKAEIFLEKIFPVDYTLSENFISVNITAKYDKDFPKLKLSVLKQLKIYNPRKIIKIFNKYLSLLYLTNDSDKHQERKKRFILFVVLSCKEINLFLSENEFKLESFDPQEISFTLNLKGEFIEIKIDDFFENLPYSFELKEMNKFNHFFIIFNDKFLRTIKAEY